MKLHQGLLAFLLFSSAMAGAAENFIVPNDLWMLPRSGTLIAQQPEIRQAVDIYLAQPDIKLIIHHGLRDEDTVYAEELRSWLLAMAVEPARIELRNDLAANSPLTIEIGKVK
ncbi:MAG: hypothetical protein K8F27_15090 [Sulfuricellaceae bacterium]|nr:hypothetical protein [Sulfuricellaceae bacterium]